MPKQKPVKYKKLCHFGGRGLKWGHTRNVLHPPFLFPPQIHFSWQRPRLLHPMHSCPSQCWLNLVKDAVSETAKTPFCLLSWCRTALKIQQQSLSPGHAIVSVEAHCTSSCSPHTGSVPMGRQCQSDTPLVPSALAVSTSASQTTLYQSEAKLGQGRFLLTASHPFANIRTHTCDLHAHGCTYKYIKMYQYTNTKAYLCLLLLFCIFSTSTVQITIHYHL